jgi:hypothetical protein
MLACHAFLKQLPSLVSIPNEQSPLIDAQAAQINSLQSQINGVLAQTSSNSDGVANLGLTIVNNPPQQFEVQPIVDKLDELINALRR